MRIPSFSRLSLRQVEDIVDSAAAGLGSISRTIVERTPSSDSSSSSSTCKPGNNDPVCQKYTSSGDTQTLPIVLGVVIPLSIAVVVLLFLHRRHVKKQRLEDINDPHKSLDFGMDGVAPRAPRNKKIGMPEMIVTDFGGHPARPSGRQMKGLSMDIAINSPYLLPATLNSSRESIHSMARSQRDEHDPYRPVTMLRPDNGSVRSGLRRDDKSSFVSASTDHQSSAENAGLIANARPMSQSYSKHGEGSSPTDSVSSHEMMPPPQSHIERKALPARKASLVYEKPLPMPTEEDMEMMPTVQYPEPTASEMPPSRSPSRSPSASPFPPRKQSMHASTRPSLVPDPSTYPEEEMPPMPISKDPGYEDGYYEDHYDDPTLAYTGRFSMEEPAHVVAAPTFEHGLHAPAPMSAQRLSVMGMRPLPPENPEDNPEQRANRIRSFYKEYFDDSKPTPAYAHYEEDYSMGDFDGAVYDPSTGGFFLPGAKPFAQPMGRRAMTPPPRGPPRSDAGSAMGLGHQRKYSTMSMGRPGPRGRPPMGMKKQLPPPMPLLSLPTPHALKGDIEVFNPLDFAPPSSFRQLQNGSRPDSPLGVARPYSPSVRAFTPLASSFDMLSAMPSPHELRKSSTFTALDFAPPSRIRDPALLSANNSDAGSIRSNRSGISAVQSGAIRAGAYRVSRIPKTMVTTREDFANQLRPTMDMVSRA